MKVIRYTTLYFLTGITLSCLVSCTKNFLDNQNTNSVLLKEEYVLDLKTTKEYLNGTYVSLAQDVYHGFNMIYPDLIADNIKPVINASGTTPLSFQYNWEQQADNTQTMSNTALNCNFLSYSCYRQIRSANFIIESVNKYKSQNPDEADDMLGQALSIRALANFTLLNFFSQPYSFSSNGNHPGIVLIKTWQWTADVPGRSTVEECYSSIIDDLTKAVTLLGVSSTGGFAFNRTAAEALLARVYLFRNDYSNARIFALSALNAIPLMTAGYPEKLYTAEDSETILKLRPSGSVYGYYTYFESQYFKGVNKQFVATNDIGSLLTEDTNDKRKIWVTQNSDRWFITKFPEKVDPVVEGTRGSYYQSVIRSSEMYLTAAEAYVELNQPDSARFYVDLIRRRANPTLPSTSESGTALRDVILTERRKELAFEGLRMFDLLRRKKGVVRSDILSGSKKELPYPNSKAIAPIPLLDIQAYKVTQNPEY